ncbi:MAG: fibronectin type III domain-containing protein, partial [Elusimicrobia bacterium]|nr:fibronectin type III domain-containing protein [Elusimicrobiota bacterium]
MKKLILLLVFSVCSVYAASSATISCYCVLNDTIPPVSPGFTSIKSLSSTVIVTTGTASDNESGLNDIPYYMKAGTSTACTEYSSGWVASSHTWTGLSPNVTYHFILKARDKSGTFSQYCSTVSTSTLCNVPSSAAGAFQSVSVNSIQSNWSANSNSPATKYFAMRATDSGFTQNTADSGWVSDIELWAADSLSTNTTYWFRVKAINNNGIETEWFNIGSTSTLAEVPAAPALSEVFISSMSISINAGVNPYPTEYAIKIASCSEDISTTGKYIQDADGALGSPAVWKSTDNWVTGGNVWIGKDELTPNTTHYVVILARNFNNIAAVNYGNKLTTVTLCNIPQAEDFSGVTPNSITANWTANSNPSGTVYELRWSTKDNYSVYDSSSGLENPSCNISGLWGNTTYWCKVRAVNCRQIVTDWKSLGSTITLNTNPDAASSLAQKRSDGSESIAFNSWTNNQTPKLEFNLSDPDANDEVKFNIYVSTDSGYSVKAVDYTSSLVNQGTTNYVCPLLDEGTYYWKVKTIDFKDAESGWTEANGGSFAFKIDTTTPAGQLISHVESHISSETVTVTAVSDALSGVHSIPYYTECSSSPAFVWISTNSGWVGSALWTTPALQANTTYYFRTKARDYALNQSSWSEVYAKATLCYVPNGLSWGTVGATALEISWTDTTANLQDTEYVAQISTGSDFSGTIYSSSTVKSAGGAIVSGFSANFGPYYGKVVAKNVAGEVSSPGNVAGTKFTAIEEPTGIKFDLLGTSSVTISGITASGENAAAFTKLGEDLDSQVYFRLAGFGTDVQTWEYNNTWTKTGLLANTTYSYWCKATNAEGVETALYGPEGKATKMESVASVDYVVGSSSIGVKANAVGGSYSNLDSGGSGVYYAICT